MPPWKHTPRKLQENESLNKARYMEKIDIFSFGALLLETIIGHLPERILPNPVLEGIFFSVSNVCLLENVIGKVLRF